MSMLEYSRTLAATVDSDVIDIFPSGKGVLYGTGTRALVLNYTRNTTSPISMDMPGNVKLTKLSPCGTRAFIMDSTGRGLLINVSIALEKPGWGVLAHKNFKKTKDVAFSPNMKFFAASGASGTTVYAVPEYSSGFFWHVLLIAAPGRPARSVVFSPDSKRVAVGCTDGTIVIEDLQGGPRIILKSHKNTIISINFTGSYLVAVSIDGVITIWQVGDDILDTQGLTNISSALEDDIDDGQAEDLKILEQFMRAGHESILSGDTGLIEDSDGWIQNGTYDNDSNNDPSVLTLSKSSDTENEINSEEIELSREYTDTQNDVSCSLKLTNDINKIEENKDTLKLNKKKDSLRNKFIEEDNTITFAGSGSAKICFGTVETIHENTATTHDLEDKSEVDRFSPAQRIPKSNNKKYTQASSWKSMIGLDSGDSIENETLDPEDCKKLFRLVIKGHASSGLTASGDRLRSKVTAASIGGEQIAVGFDNGNVGLYTIPALENISITSISNSSITAAVLKKGILAYSAANGKEFGIIDIVQQRTVSVQKAYSLSCAALSTPSGAKPQLVGVGGSDGLQVYMLDSGMLVKYWGGTYASVTTLCFTPSNNAIIAGYTDGIVRAYEFSSFKEFRTLHIAALAEPFRGSRGLVNTNRNKLENLNIEDLGPVSQLSLDPSGELLAIALEYSFEIYIVHLASGNMQEVLAVHSDIIANVIWAPVLGGRLLTSSIVGELKLWSLFERDKEPEDVEIGRKCSTVTFHPVQPELIAISHIGGDISIVNIDTGDFLSITSCIRDIGTAQREQDQFAAHNKRSIRTENKHALEDGVARHQYFSTMIFTPCGSLLICGSDQSPDLCIYDARSLKYFLTLVGKVSVTKSTDLSGVRRFVSTRKLAAAGVSRNFETLPEREFQLSSVNITSDGRTVIAATTHGLFCFEHATFNNKNHVKSDALELSNTSGEVNAFVPVSLETEDTIQHLAKFAINKDWNSTLKISVSLQDIEIFQSVLNIIPGDSVLEAITSLPLNLILPLLQLLIQALEEGKHLVLILAWTEVLLAFQRQAFLDPHRANNSDETIDKLKFGCDLLLTRLSKALSSERLRRDVSLKNSALMNMILS